MQQLFSRRYRPWSVFAACKATSSYFVKPQRNMSSATYLCLVPHLFLISTTKPRSPSCHADLPLTLSSADLAASPSSINLGSDLLKSLELKSLAWLSYIGQGEAFDCITISTPEHKPCVAANHQPCNATIGSILFVSAGRLTESSTGLSSAAQSFWSI